MANTKKRTEETVEKIRARVRANKPATENLVTNESANNNIETAVITHLTEIENTNNSRLLLNDLISTEVSLVDEKKAKNDPNVLKNYSVFGNYLKFSDKLNLKVPSDNQNILKHPQDCLEILESLYPLGRIILGLEFDIEKDQYIGDRVQWYKSSENNISREGVLIEIKYKTLYLITKTARIANEFLIKSQFSLEEFKKLTKTTLIKDKLNLVTEINLTDLKDILEGITRIFPDIKFPEFKAEKRIKPSNKAFKIKQIEATPNHSTCLDILSLIIKPQEFSDNANFSDIQINHKGKRFNAYTALTVPKPETIEINDINLTLVKCFDWKDRKILRLIFTEALHHQGEFALSFRWILEKLGELKTGGKTLEEKLEDLRSRFLKYRSVSIRWKYKLGKKIEADSITGGNIFIIQTTDFYDRKRGENSYDIETRISLGNWFEINRNLIREFTRIPQKLLSINTTYHWRAFAIGEKICVLMRTNKEKILNSDSAYRVPIKLSMKCLLDEIINPLELKQCLEDSKKGYDFKDSLIKETQYLEKELGWKFNWIGLTENQSLNDFYNSVSFIAYVDSELESAILGEKVIKKIDSKPSKVPLTIEGDLVKKLRKKLKLTQEIFGKSIEYSRTLITKIERGSELASEDFIKSLYKKYINEIDKLHD